MAKGWVMQILPIHFCTCVYTHVDTIKYLHKRQKTSKFNHNIFNYSQIMCVHHFSSTSNLRVKHWISFIPYHNSKRSRWTANVYTVVCKLLWIYVERKTLSTNVASFFSYQHLLLLFFSNTYLFKWPVSTLDTDKKLSKFHQSVSQDPIPSLYYAYGKNCL